MIQIIVAERGWVFVGKVSREGDSVVITECRNIRRWGTTGGLGELALSGPKGDTKLDSFGTVRIHVLAVVCTIDCNQSAWSGK